MSSRCAVWPRGSQSIIGIRDRNDARAQRNLTSAQTTWVSVSIQTLVMVKYQQRFFLKAIDVANRHPTEFRMLANPFEFVCRERAGFQQNVVGHADFADV